MIYVQLSFQRKTYKIDKHMFREMIWTPNSNFPSKIKSVNVQKQNNCENIYSQLHHHMSFTKEKDDKDDKSTKDSKCNERTNAYGTVRYI